MRSEIVRLDQAIQRANRIADQAVSDAAMHAKEDILIHKHTDEILEGMRDDNRRHYAEVEKGLELMRGMYQRAQEDFAARLDTQDVNTNNRISSSVKMALDNMSSSVVAFRDTMSATIKGVSEMLVANVNNQAKVNEALFSQIGSKDEKIEKLDGRVWALMLTSFGTITTVLLAIIGALITAAFKHWI